MARTNQARVSQPANDIIYKQKIRTICSDFFVVPPGRNYFISFNLKNT